MSNYLPASDASPSGSFSNISLSSYSKSNPIDLTVEDDESDDYSRATKRPRTEDSPSIRRSSYASPPLPSVATRAPSTMSSFTSFNQKPAIAPSDTSFMKPSVFHSQQPAISNPSSVYRPPFVGPSNSAAFFPERQISVAQNMPSPYPQHIQARPIMEKSRSQVIDLTGSPSPPPQLAAVQPPLPADLSPKTPVCIGQLVVTALVLYPVHYLLPQAGEAEWAPVKLQYEHTPNKPGGSETIHIKTPGGKAGNGQVLEGEPFGVVEQKVANYLGSMLGKGLIRLDAKVRKGLPNLPILPLQMLVYTPKGNIPVVGNYLHQNGLFLEHPVPPYDPSRSNYHYWNPHNPPNGAAHRIYQMANRNHYPMNNQGQNRWTTPVVAGKSVEVQRSQVDELFRSLKSGDELRETEAAPQVATKLYPHQKKALTFLLEREREQPGSDGNFSSLWQARPSSSTKRPSSWYHIVTQAEVFEEPQEAKGSILADDMGLGKTITCVSLLAATLDSAKAFAESPLETVAPPGRPPDDPDASHFGGSVWGMPEVELSGKNKAKAQRLQEKLEADYTRSCRLKTKSRATLIICPLSTVSNWEDQFREHWKGEVHVVGGGSGVCPPPAQSQSSSSQMMLIGDFKPPTSTKVREGRALKVYVYHGVARRPDASYLADFDAVITTYATLASEFSKQTRSTTAAAEPEEEDEGSSDGIAELDEYGNMIVKLPKPKKNGLKRKMATQTPGVEATSALQSVHWFRVVLDEAHSIKETGTVASRACCDLVADRRLCLTGTPVQNKLDDIFALIKFLRMKPFDEKTTWTEFIGGPVKFGQTLGVARLQTIMKCITLRRTKESKTQDGRRILDLPPRRDELRYLKFDEQEQGIYDQFFNESKAEFDEMSDKNEVMKNYVGILQKILRLRQICDHFELVEGKGPTEESQLPSYEDILEAISREGFTLPRAMTIFAILREAATTQCVECNAELCASDAQNEACDADPPKRTKKAKNSSRAPTRANSPAAPRAVLTRCQHLFCIECYRSCICPGWPNVSADTRRSCSACQTGLCPSDAIEVKTEPQETTKKKVQKREKRQRGQSLDNFHPSTKVKALLGDLVGLSKKNPYSNNYDPSAVEVQMVDDQGNDLDDGVVKTVVFSQWTSMLDKIEDALEAAGIRYDRLDGTMKRDERTKAMDALKHDPSCEVLLVSLKAGGVGLNLTAAQRVYLMDPYWNPAVENQAVDRIHRLGQTRPVTTIKLIIENSIEARLLEVQKKKTALANMTLGTSYSKAEMMARRMEDLSQLFDNS
ncbi:SNF2 family DNA-dependent ATPase [Mycena floridula]|nr:SNF2 family DNA-dependent ATPase [Mycena floridula]